MDLRVIECEVVNRNELAQDLVQLQRFSGAILKLRVS